MWRSQVARWFWVLKVIGSNPFSPNSPKKEDGEKKNKKDGIWPNGRATVFGAVL